MTKAEAVVLRAAFKLLRAKIKFQETGSGKELLEMEKAVDGVVEATKEASKEIKDWVFVKQGSNPNEPLMQCDGCGEEEKVQCPLPMNQFVDVVNGFRTRHIDCGPVAEKVAGA